MLTEAEIKAYTVDIPNELQKLRGQASGCAPVTCSAALLEIIKTCEDYQNANTEGVELERQCDDGYRALSKVITIASGALAEIKAQQNE